VTSSDDSKQYPRRCTRCQATIFSEREHDCVFRASNRDAVPLSDLRDMDAHRLIADADRRESLRYRIVSQHDDIRSQPGQTIVHIPPERTGSEIGQTTRSGRAPISVDNSSDVQRCMPTLPWCNDCWDQAAEGTKEELDGRPDECQHCDSTRVFWI